MSLPVAHQMPDPKTIPPLVAVSQHDPSVVYYVDDPSRLRKYEPGLRYRRWTLISWFQPFDCPPAAWKRVSAARDGVATLRAARQAANANPDVVTYAEYVEAFTELVEAEQARAIIEGGIA